MSSVKKKEAPFDHMVKLIIIGDSGVGKTNMIMKFCQQGFRDNYIATIGVDFKVKTIQVDDKRFKLQIWDTAGQQRFRNITQTYYKGAVGVILAYSITSEISYDNIQKWILQMNDSTNQDIKMVLVGNKSDIGSQRKVSVEDGKKLGDKYKIPFFQCSAKTGYNIQQIFMKLGRDIKDKIEKQNLLLMQKGTAIQKIETQQKKSCQC